MDLLTSAWIPVRVAHGLGPIKLLTYEELLCTEGNWTIALPRDDLELACLQLLICITQILFLPLDDAALRIHFTKLLNPEHFANRTASFRHWFDLDHPTQPFMQTRGVEAKDITPIQKLLVGLPEGNNHAFFNEVGEVKRLGPAIAAIALFNQAMNCPSFGGGFKGGLRGGAPITTLVRGKDLRETIWRNVLTLPRIQERLPDYEPDFSNDLPTWIKPIRAQETIYALLQIGLARGLFWQPAHVELVKAEQEAPCDLLSGAPGAGYIGFRKEKFNFIVEGVWPHPHGILIESLKKGAIEKKFLSFTRTDPAWTLLSEFVIPQDLSGSEIKQGCIPAGPVMQANEIPRRDGRLELIVGGYRNKQAAVLERRHELMSLAAAWRAHREQIIRLVNLGKEAKDRLHNELRRAAQGNPARGIPGISVPLYELGEKAYYARSETLFHQILDQETPESLEKFADTLVHLCKTLFEELTEPYTHKPELLPIIALTRRNLSKGLQELYGEII